MIEAAIFVVFPLCLAIGACSDLFTMTIPNRASAILVATFFLVAPLAGLTLPVIGMHATAAVLVFGVCFTLFALNIMGGGDAKLLSASALWFGFNISLVEFVLYVSICGGLLTFAILLLRTQENLILAARLPVPRLLLTAKKIPYGIAIGVGGFLAYPSSPLMQAALARF